jgi:hypothetical protein
MHLGVVGIPERQVWILDKGSIKTTAQLTSPNILDDTAKRGV